MYRHRRRKGWRARRGRYHWRRGGRFWRGWRKYRRWGRRHHRTVRTVNVTAHEPTRHRYVWVKGWEPLANLCSSDKPTSEAQPYGSIEPQLQITSPSWHGTWGKHYFTPSNLLLRSAAYWNQWSDDWATFDYVKFCGGYITIWPDEQAAWMINFDPYLQTKKLTGDKNQEDLWVHPGILLNSPHTHLILPQSYMPRKKPYKIRIAAPPGWKGLQRFPDAMGYILVHWSWTWFVLTRGAFYETGNFSATGDLCQAAPWWATNSYYDKWTARAKYEDCSSDQTGNKKGWGPFLPCSIGNRYASTSIWFQYKLKFKFAGNAIWRAVPRNFRNSGMVPEPKGPGDADASETEETAPQRPQHEADIWPEDLDSDGILTDRALRRITQHSGEDLRRKLENQRRLRHIHDKLRSILRDRGLLKRQRLRDGLTGKEARHPPPLHPPKKKRLIAA
nr:ORF1 [Torque teno felis virus]